MARKPKTTADKPQQQQQPTLPEPMPEPQEKPAASLEALAAAAAAQTKAHAARRAKYERKGKGTTIPRAVVQVSDFLDPQATDPEDSPASVYEAIRAGIGETYTAAAGIEFGAGNATLAFYALRHFGENLPPLALGTAKAHKYQPRTKGLERPDTPLFLSWDAIEDHAVGHDGEGKPFAKEYITAWREAVACMNAKVKEGRDEMDVLRGGASQVGSIKHAIAASDFETASARQTRLALLSDQFDAAKRAVERAALQAVGLDDVIRTAKDVQVPFLAPGGIACQNITNPTGTVYTHSLTALRERAKGNKETPGAIHKRIAERTLTLPETVTGEERMQALATETASVHATARAKASRKPRTGTGSGPAAVVVKGGTFAETLAALTTNVNPADLGPDDQEAIVGFLSWALANDPSAELDAPGWLEMALRANAGDDAGTDDDDASAGTGTE